MLTYCFILARYYPFCTWIKLVFNTITIILIASQKVVVCNSGHVELRIYRGSYMNADILLNLFEEIELRKRDNMRGLPIILSFFSNQV